MGPKHAAGDVTLREALERSRNRKAPAFSSDAASPKAREFFHCHDVAHLVFGCDTSLLGEGTLKIFTLFGTTLSFRDHFAGYAAADATGLFTNYSALHVASNVPRLLVRFPQTIVRARRMSKPWPWRAHDRYLDATLSEIRSEFNIMVFD